MSRAVKNVVGEGTAPMGPLAMAHGVTQRSPGSTAPDQNVGHNGATLGATRVHANDALSGLRRCDWVFTQGFTLGYRMTPVPGYERAAPTEESGRGPPTPTGSNSIAQGATLGSRSHQPTKAPTGRHSSRPAPITPSTRTDAGADPRDLALLGRSRNDALSGLRRFCEPLTQGHALGYGRTPLRGYATRRGVTLIELLVVIMIMLMITAIAIPVLAPSMKNRDVREAARMIDVFINGARTRALQSGHSYGVMIERMPGQPNGSVTLSYCEQPDAYTGDYASAVSYPGMPPGPAGSTINLVGNGAFGFLVPPVPPATTPTIGPMVFPKGDTGWIAGPAPGGTGYLTNIAPGDLLVVKGVQYRIWAGEPFIDIDQNGVCGVTSGSPPGTPTGVQEPYIDVDGSNTWTPPNYPGSRTFDANQPYVDPASNYFVQPNAAAGSPFPIITVGSPSAYITYTQFDPVQAAQDIGKANLARVNGVWPYVFKAASPFPGDSFSFLRRPVKTSAPSIQLPGGAVIDLGANLPYLPPGQQQGRIIPVPGSGIEVQAANANELGLWATFDCNPLLDPSLSGQLAGVSAQNPPLSDSTPIIITFLPSGTVDRVYSWSEIDSDAISASGATVNWSDWLGRIPAGPIYLLVGQQGLINGDPDVLPRIALNEAPLKPAFNVQDPNALWVVINPRTGAVATAENVGFDLTVPPVSAGSASFNSMFIYWNANVYYARRLARSMLDMGGR